MVLSDDMNIWLMWVLIICLLFLNNQLIHLLVTLLMWRTNARGHGLLTVLTNVSVTYWKVLPTITPA